MLLGACQGLKKTTPSRLVVACGSVLTAILAGVFSQLTALKILGIYLGALLGMLTMNVGLASVTSASLGVTIVSPRHYCSKQGLFSRSSLKVNKSTETRTAKATTHSRLPC